MAQVRSGPAVDSEAPRLAVEDRDRERRCDMSPRPVELIYGTYAQLRRRNNVVFALLFVPTCSAMLFSIATDWDMPWLSILFLVFLAVTAAFVIADATGHTRSSRY